MAFFLLFTIAVVGKAQQNLFRNFNVKDGLPSSEVYEMLQESTGYFWFATDMGVSRFNGYEFKNFTTEDGLPDNTIFGIQEDGKHRIWFRSSSGKLSYFHQEKIITLPANDELATLLKGTLVTSLYVDKGDTIWLGLSEQFFLKIEPGWQAHHIKKIQIPCEGQYIYEIDTDGFIYGGYSMKKQKIHVFHSGQLLYTLPLDIDDDLGFKARFQVKKLKDKTYLASVHTTLLSFDECGLRFKKKEKEMIICSLKDADNTWLAGTYLGLKIIDFDSNHPDSSFQLFNEKTITALCIDKENELWICTKGHGIFYIPFRNIRYYLPENGFPQSSIACMGVLGQQVCVGFLNGQVCKIAERNIHTYSFDSHTKKESWVSEVTGFLDWNNTKQYVSTNRGIYEFSRAANRFKAIKKEGTKKIIALKDRSILSLRFRALTQYDSLFSSTKSLVYGLLDYSDNIYEDRHGIIWICSSNGLYTYTKTDSLQYAGIQYHPLLKSRVVDLADGENNSLWMVSRGEGVIVKRGEFFFQIKKKDGLSSNMCRTLYVDSANTIWVGTNHGLNKITVSSYQPFRYKIDTYYSKNGLLTNEVNTIVKHNNKLWLAHNNGISVLDASQLKDNNTPPPIYITRLLINGERADTKNVHSLSYSENYVEIQYNGLSYKDPGKIEYKYQLAGLDTHWNYASNTVVKFQTLPAGTYSFIVYAINNDGYLSRSPAKFTFTILPPWWQTGWFRVSFALAGVGLMMIAFTQRLRVIEKRERLKTIQQTRIATAELKALRSQMNPHFVFNAINSIQYFITNNDPKSSQKYLSKFAKLIRYVVDNSKPTSIPLCNELEALTIYLELESLRFKNKFEYDIFMDENIESDVIKIPSMLLQPYIENAIWHGLMHKQTGVAILNVQFFLKENRLLCVIQDNGIGRKKSAEIKRLYTNSSHQSVGMSITQERLDIFNQIQDNKSLSVSIIDLQDEKDNPAGTRVELNIPIY